MDIVTLRSKTAEELRLILAEQRERLADFRFQMGTRELKNVHEIRNTRRTIARIITLLKAQASGSNRLSASDAVNSPV